MFLTSKNYKKYLNWQTNMITKKSKTLKSFRLSSTKKQKVSYGGFFCKNKVKRTKVKQWFIGIIIGMFSESSFMLVYIFRVSLVTIAQSYQILERVFNCLPPPVLWCQKKHGMNRVNDHLLSQCKNTAWFNLEGSVVAKTYPKHSKKQHSFVVVAA